MVKTDFTKLQLRIKVYHFCSVNILKNVMKTSSLALLSLDQLNDLFFKHKAGSIKNLGRQMKDTVASIQFSFRPEIVRDHAVFYLM